MSNRKRRVPAPFSEPHAAPEPEDELGGEPQPPGEEEEEELEDLVPRVLIGRVADLGPFAPQPISEREASMPLWFLLTDDADLVGVFSRYPEGPMLASRADAVLGALRRFTLERNHELQELLGITDGVQYGFHVDAKLEDVVESFEDDGFEVVGALREGEIVAEPEP